MLGKCLLQYLVRLKNGQCTNHIIIIFLNLRQTKDTNKKVNVTKNELRTNAYVRLFKEKSSLKCLYEQSYTRFELNVCTTSRIYIQKVLEKEEKI